MFIREHTTSRIYLLKEHDSTEIKNLFTFLKDFIQESISNDLNTVCKQVIEFFQEDKISPTKYNFFALRDQICLLAYLVLPIVRTTKVTFLVEIRKVILSLSHQEKRKKALLESNLLGIS